MAHVTCVAAARRGGKVVVGADSAGVAPWLLHLETRADSKVFRRLDGRGEWWAFGFTSSFRMGDLLRYKLELPEVRPKDDLREFMVTRFVDESLRKALGEGGYRRKHDEVESGGTFLVVFRGEIFKVEDDFQVGQLAAPYAAVGCGEHLALGAMSALWDNLPGNSAQFMVGSALEAAARYSAGVRGPFNFVEVEAPVPASGTGSSGAPEPPRAGA